MGRPRPYWTPMIFLKYYLQILLPLLACLVGYELLVTPNVQPAKSIKPSRWDSPV